MNEYKYKQLAKGLYVSKPSANVEMHTLPVTSVDTRINVNAMHDAKVEQWEHCIETLSYILQGDLNFNADEFRKDCRGDIVKFIMGES